MTKQLPRSARRLFAVLLVLTLALSALGSAADPSAFQDLRWRLVGPFRGGWATVVAGIPGDLAIGYLGAADGGVWKTTDAGITWKPLFNSQGSASIGALAIAPSDGKVIWVGTGQIHQRWDIVDGDGVYRSSDGGATWSHVGLKDTRHIGAIWVDPRNADVAVVAALGHVFGPNAERGLFRTEDGGQTWAHVLSRGVDIGAADIAGDAATPDVLYASLWQVRRHPWLDYFQPPVGAGSGIVKSTDGGRTWAPVGGSGLPAGPLGRIELAVAPKLEGQRVWAAIQLPAGGSLYRSDDGGASFSLVQEKGMASAYTSGVFADPQDPETLWVMGQSLRRSQDGGKTFSFVKGSPGGDDYHFLWIDPTSSRHMITGADQGAVLTLNGGETWSSWYNQPTGQFYRLGVDDRFPYWIYSGQQDSGTVGIASRSDYGQITFRDWHPVGGDERDGDVPDPANPDTVYGAGLGSRVSKWNAATAQVQNVSPWPVASYAAAPGSTRYRFGWITPLAISKRPPHAIYQGAQVLLRSLDGGKTWQEVSPDLTGAKLDAKSKECQGEVPRERASACGWAVIFAISPSKAADGVVWVGTENGRVHLTRDDAKTWQEVTPPGLADWSKINLIDASASDPATAYLAVDRHRADEFQPMAYRTHDYGATWTEIGHGLPAGAWVGVVRQDPQRANVLYAGTSRGVWVSQDDGETWQSLQLNLPTTGINDLLVHGDDLIVATEGRAIWILDNVTPLREERRVAEEPFLVQPARAYRLRGNQNKDTPLPPEEPRGENPPVGAMVDYVLPAGAEGVVTLEILDESGKLVRRFASDDAEVKLEARVYFTDRFLGPAPRLGTGPGHHRFVWNLRRERPRALAYDFSIAALPGRPTPLLPEGAFVLPGNYLLRLSAGGKTSEQKLEVLLDPRVRVAAGELEELLAFQQEVEAAIAKSTQLAAARRSAVARLGELASSKASGSKKRIEKALAKNEKLVSAPEEDPEGANEALAALAGDLESIDAAPTAAQRQVFALYAEGIARFAAKWQSFSKDLPF